MTTENATTNAYVAKWRQYKPQLMALAIGLAVGPIFTNYMGWQLTVGAADARVRAGIVEQQAGFCEANARVDVKEPGKLEWSQRSDLAKKWAMMPGRSAVDSDVVSACAGKLAG